MRLHYFDLGTMQPGNIPVPAYLIQTTDNLNILIDTGWPLSFVEHPRHPPGLTVTVRPEDTIVSRLAVLGLAPSDIDYLICTHLDEDHCGNHDLFADAVLVVQRQHYEFAKSGHPRFVGSRDIWDHPSLKYRLIDGDQELVPGVVLLETSGHVPGHQSILVRLPKSGNVLLAADAVMHRSMADAPTRQIFITDMDDESNIRRSTQKISDIANEENVAFTVYGHDAEQWVSLRHSPAFYE